MYRVILQYTAAWNLCCCKMLQEQALILQHYNTNSIFPPLCSQHPLLPVNILSRSPLISPLSHSFFCLYLSSHFSTIFTLIFIFSHPFIFPYYYIFSLSPPFTPPPHLSLDKWSQSHACALGYRRREEEKSSLAYETERWWENQVLCLDDLMNK